MKKKKIIISCVLAVICAIIIFLFSSMDISESNYKSKATINNVIDKIINLIQILGITNKDFSTIEKENIVEILNLPFRKLAHMSEYCILTIFILIAISKIHIKSKNKFIIAILICFIYACCDEYHQTFVRGRTGQFSDALIDLLGGLFGCLAFYLTKSIQKTIHNKRDNSNNLAKKENRTSNI